MTERELKTFALVGIKIRIQGIEKQLDKIKDRKAFDRTAEELRRLWIEYNNLWNELLNT